MYVVYFVMCFQSSCFLGVKHVEKCMLSLWHGSHRTMPVLSLCRTIIETSVDPKKGAVAFFRNLCRENSRKMEGRERITTCKMKKKGGNRNRSLY
jgi:hypothetical protein